MNKQTLQALLTEMGVPAKRNKLDRKNLQWCMAYLNQSVMQNPDMQFAYTHPEYHKVMEELLRRWKL